MSAALLSGQTTAAYRDISCCGRRGLAPFTLAGCFSAEGACVELGRLPLEHDAAHLTALAAVADASAHVAREKADAGLIPILGRPWKAPQCPWQGRWRVISGRR